MYDKFNFIHKCINMNSIKYQVGYKHKFMNTQPWTLANIYLPLAYIYIALKVMHLIWPHKQTSVHKEEPALM